MSKKLLTVVTLMASTGIVMAQNAPPDAGMGRDPAARFKSLDKNNDGKLTSEEFAAIMQQMMRPGGAQGGAQGGTPPAGSQQGAPAAGGPPAGADDSGMDAMMNSAERFKQVDFKQVDKNNDGKVTVEEFTSAMLQMREGQQGAPAASGKGGK